MRAKREVNAPGSMVRVAVGRLLALGKLSGKSGTGGRPQLALRSCESPQQLGVAVTRRL